MEFGSYVCRVCGRRYKRRDAIFGDIDRRVCPDCLAKEKRAKMLDKEEKSADIDSYLDSHEMLRDYHTFLGNLRKYLGPLVKIEKVDLIDTEDGQKIGVYVNKGLGVEGYYKFLEDFFMKQTKKIRGRVIVVDK